MKYLILSGPEAGNVGEPKELRPLYKDASTVIYGDGDVDIRPLAGFLLIGKSFPALRTETSASGSGPFEKIAAGWWGSFIALRQDVGKACLEIYVDPSGLLPCYYAVNGNKTTIGSDARCVLEAASVPIELDWDEVALQLFRRDLRSSHCSLRGLREVPAGASMDLQDSSARPVAVWSPAHCLTGAQPVPFEAAAKRIKSVIEESVKSLAGGSGRILAGVSGGLDSSIVAAALAQSGADFECFTMYYGDSDADERRYARALAKHLGVRLREYSYRIEDVDLEMSSVGTLPRPIGWPFQQSLDRACLRALGETGATSIMRGTGGDAVFCYNNSASPIVDALIESGPLAAARTCRDVSKLSIDAGKWAGVLPHDAMLPGN